MYCIYDLEIIQAIPPKDEADRIEGIQYCAGWSDFKNMGISVGAICYLSDLNGEYEVSHPIGFTDIEDLIYETDTTEIDGLHYKFGGFNSKKFDDSLMKANGFNVSSDFDILEMVLQAAGMENIKYWEMEPKRSYSLDRITRANGMEKTGRGDLAPILWQQGKKREVLDYCKNDALIEAKVLKLLLNGELIDPNTIDSAFPVKLHWAPGRHKSN